MNQSISPLQQAFDLRPDLGELFVSYSSQLWSDNLVDPVLLELCRLRIAQLLGDGEQMMLRYQSAIDAGLTEGKVVDLSHYSTSPLFTDHERICLNYTEQFLIDVHSITDADADRVKAGMTDPDFVAFTVALGLLEGVARLRLALGLTGPVPDEPMIVSAPAPGRPAR